MQNGIAHGSRDRPASTPEAVEKFLQAVRNRWKNNIKKEEIGKRAATGKLKGFTIVE